MRPAAPSWTACVDAALLVVAGFVVDVPAEVPVVLVARVVVTAGLLGVVSGVEVVTDVLGVVAPAVVGVVPVAVELPEVVGFFPTQEVSDPVLMVNGADDAVDPVESRMVRPMDVPAAMLAIHVTEVLVV